MGRLRTIRPRVATIDIRRVKPLARDNKRPDRFYSSPEWRSLLAEIKRERGARCEDPRCKTPHGPWGRLLGDHIVEIKDGGAKLDKLNIMLRCDPCHGRKTAAERTKRLSQSYDCFI